MATVFFWNTKATCRQRRQLELLVGSNDHSSNPGSMSVGAGQGDPIFALPVPFILVQCSHPLIVGSRHLFAFSRLQNITQCCVFFFFFSRFPPASESHFPPSLFPLPVHFPTLSHGIPPLPVRERDASFCLHAIA